MVRHIELCLDEIQCEIETLDTTVFGTIGQTALQGHVAGMRAIIQAWRSECSPLLAVGDEAAAGEMDDLTAIRGLDPSDAAMLAIKGVVRFQTIADWRPDDLAALGGGKALMRRIAVENWIEQAAILATGRPTHFSAMRTAEIDVKAATPAALQQMVADFAASTAAGANATDADARTTRPALAAAPDPSASSPAVARPAGRALGAGLRHVAAALVVATGLGALSATAVVDVDALTAIGWQLVEVKLGGLGYLRHLFALG